MKDYSFKPKSKYHEFESPIHIIWRKGTPDDPYIPRTDNVKVVNQRIVLLEVPDSNYGVKIPSMKEISYEGFIQKEIGVQEFYVDYTNGFIYTHANQEGKTLSCSYRGRGMLLYPTQRIIHWNNKDSFENLFDIIESANKQIADLTEKTNDYLNVQEKVLSVISEAREMIYIMGVATDESKQATEDARRVYRSTLLIWKPYVKEFEDLKTTYPTPNFGWTVAVSSENIIYRYDGDEWIPIKEDVLADEMALATEDRDGLLSKEGYVKLRDISNFVNLKTIVILTGEGSVESGEIPYHVVTPFEGKIESISTSFSSEGSSATIIIIEKQLQSGDWEAITEELVVEAKTTYKEFSEEINDIIVNKGDKFRASVTESGEHTNLSLNININMNTGVL